MRNILAAAAAVLQGFNPLRCIFGLAVVVSALWTPAVRAASPGGGLWTDFDEAGFRPPGERLVLADAYRTLELDRTGLRILLDGAPNEDAVDLRHSPAILPLPLPGGGYGRFRIVESPIMAPELAARFPEIRTYRGQGIDDPLASVRFDLTPAGFHAAVHTTSGTIYIDPYSRDAVDYYSSYFTRDARNPAAGDFHCGVSEAAQPSVKRASEPAAATGAELRTLRLAVATTGEYTAFHGGTVAGALAAIATTMNRVNEIFEREVAIRMILIADNDRIVYTDPATDPYTNSDKYAMLGQNQTNLDAVIGNANYDIGHVFCTAGGGVASLYSACTISKARGVTGLSSPTGDYFAVGFVAHEMGHQWSAPHTFNGDAGACAGNRSAGGAYEPGSGSTILSYGGLCGGQNLQSRRDDYYHANSYHSISNFAALLLPGSCLTPVATGNTPPVVAPGPIVTIPLETPFELCGNAIDADGDPLTFSWEQYDRGSAGHPDNPVDDAPIFRSFPAVTSPCRTFPKLGDLLNNTHTLGEILPTYARTMHFRLTVRDLRSGGGGVGVDTGTTVTVAAEAGPFEVLAPDAAAVWQAGADEAVVWDVAGTDLPPVSCAAVDVVLSVDGGFSFPHVLAAASPNDGSETVRVPPALAATTTARLKVRCTDNVFFDISNTDFEILPDILSLSVDGVFLDENLDGLGNPGETIVYSYQVTNTGVTPTLLTNVSVSDASGAPVTCPSGAPGTPDLIPSLGIGATEICTATATLTQADVDAGRRDTTAQVDSDQTAPLAVPVTVPIPQNPAIDLVKNGALDTGTDGAANAGDLINYLLQVTNTGNVTLTDVEISDPLLPALACSGSAPGTPDRIPSLAPGATELCTGSYTLVQSDADAGVVHNTATVVAEEPGGVQLGKQDSHTEPVPRIPFACTGEAYIVQSQNAQLTRIDPSGSSFSFVPIGAATGIEINNLGFRSTDGLLYALELSYNGNVQVIQIDGTGAVFHLGRPERLPPEPRFDAGDVSPDGTTMYITGTNQDLYRLDLTTAPILPAVTSVAVSGATGWVFDWAVSPVDGKLYGGDSTSGQLAVLDPATGVRTDLNLAGLPAGSGYGGAWFDAAGHLFLYQNSGVLYEIDLSGPTVVNTQVGPGATRNDGAACVDLTPPAAAVSLVKTGALDLGGNGTTDAGDLIDYTFDVTNQGTDALTDVTISDPSVPSITCPGGHPIPSLAGGASVTCTGSYAISQADVDARVRDNTAAVTGQHTGGPVSAQDSHSETIPAAPGAGPLPFPCTGDAYIVQNQNAQLTRVDQSVSPFVFVDIGTATGIEINNLGFRSTDGLLYAVELSSSGNVQVIQIDANGDVIGLGRPSGLPSNKRFDAGDVSPDGTTMYITTNNQPLYRLDLTSLPALPAVTSVAVDGATGYVFDWAVSPVDGMLYGGDSSQGQLARLDPTTGVRTDVNLVGLPSGSGYGGAWFDAAGTLFLFQNSGVLYEIELAGPTVVNTQVGPGATRNDGAACVDLTPPAAALSLVKTGALDLGGNGTTDVGDLIDYSFDVTNQGTDALTDVTISDPSVPSITCPGGHPIPSLAGGATVTCTGSYAITQADVDARVRNNTAGVTGTHGSGPVSAQDSHSETIPAPPGAGPVPFACTGDAYIVQDQNAQLTRVDPSVSPFTFVPVGGVTGREINNLGFRSTDGLLYAVELSAGGNVQILQIDSNGDVVGLGRPPGLPTGPRFDAGDVSPDGSTMYITSNNQALYRLDLTAVPTLPAVTSVAVSGASGFVFDWAVSPVDGLLYGGDSSSGQLATLNPVTGVRTDVNVAGLPSGSGYGGAWFDSSGRLFLYRNSGAIYEIDLAGSAGPTVVGTQTGPGATRNDGAACITAP